MFYVTVFLVALCLHIVNYFGVQPSKSSAFRFIIVLSALSGTCYL